MRSSSPIITHPIITTTTRPTITYRSSSTPRINTISKTRPPITVTTSSSITIRIIIIRHIAVILRRVECLTTNDNAKDRSKYMDGSIVRSNPKISTINDHYKYYIYKYVSLQQLSYRYTYFSLEANALGDFGSSPLLQKITENRKNNFVHAYPKTQGHGYNGNSAYDEYKIMITQILCVPSPQKSFLRSSMILIYTLYIHNTVRNERNQNVTNCSLA